jgi:platelet-activating factor acetylhydrolase IB subunit alpha
MRWAPGIVKAISTDNTGGQSAKGTEALEIDASGQIFSDTQIRCVIATGGVDMKLRIFAG